MLGINKLNLLEIQDSSNNKPHAVVAIIVGFCMTHVPLLVRRRWSSFHPQF